MEPFKTKLIGQESTESIFNKIIDDPPHIFITGIYGSGKTTICNEFINYYYKKHNIKDRSSWIMNLSSEKDRGIHCVRQNVAEFVHHSSAKLGIYRWIIIDDADSLPIISQQALRRPMETHAHTTRFFFISRHPSDLIAPLRSRCLHLEIETLSPFDFINISLKKYKASFDIDSDGLTFLFTLAQTPCQIESMIKILAYYYKDKTNLSINDINQLFGSPSYNSSIQILESIIKKNEKELLHLFFKVWSTGISYEDFLNELNMYIKQLGILKPDISQKLYYIIMRGWIQFAQGKTHSFDILRLLIDANTIK
jgi:DNA polymerase III delta prime subunit